MKTEQVIQRLTNEVETLGGEHVTLKKEDARRILERMNSLEGVAAALLRSTHESQTPVILPFKTKP